MVKHAQPGGDGNVLKDDRRARLKTAGGDRTSLPIEHCGVRPTGAHPRVYRRRRATLRRERRRHAAQQRT